MPLMIRQIEADESVSAHLALDALGKIIPSTALAEVIAQHGVQEERDRKLPAIATLVLCIAMNLYAHEALPAVFRRLVAGLRWLWSDPSDLRVSKSAISQARYRLGAPVLVSLFHRVCQPLATPDTPGAFLFGLRLMAFDGTMVNLADTAANVAAFGRRPASRGTCAWPQAQLVALCESGTHAICDAGLWPYNHDEETGVRRLLRSVTSGMLVLSDMGLHSYDLLAATLGRGAQILNRVPSHLKPQVITTLADGTQLVQLRPSDGKRRRRGEHIVVRLIRYTLDDPCRVGHRQEHRLVTSLLDPATAPAEELILAYHTRWEIELTVDELVIHQRPVLPLRSKLPVGVVQELYGLLIAHYLVRAVMVDAAATVSLAPTRMSFLESLRLIREAMPDFQRAAPAQHALIYAALLTDIAATALPPRANRINPRVVKQKLSNFPVKRPVHRGWPQPIKPFRDTIQMLN
ncbi:MAG: IS4 family transposase [Chloroflexi bacterium]|nr:MAG: IS4 family transposase [Chloroflexota bacterium]